VLPIGLAINCTNHYCGNTADISIFKQNLPFHNLATLKSDHEKTMVDLGPLQDTHGDKWAILVDKGYQGVQDYIRGIHPIKKQPNRRLSRSDEESNKTISSDRIIVENYFGRLCTLWGICSNKFRWSRDLYDMIFKACVALTNVHIRRNSLRSNDGDHYNRCRNRLHHIGVDGRNKRNAASTLYRTRRRLRLEATFTNAGSGSDVDDFDITQL
jgi:hypothetical protein